jgi:hypothetical protein
MWQAEAKPLRALEASRWRHLTCLWSSLQHQCQQVYDCIYCNINSAWSKLWPPYLIQALAYIWGMEPSSSIWKISRHGCAQLLLLHDNLLIILIIRGVQPPVVVQGYDIMMRTCCWGYDGAFEGCLATECGYRGLPRFPLDKPTLLHWTVMPWEVHQRQVGIWSRNLNEEQ